ncbi:MAG: WYL domain-containing protein [Muribaculaceae bacterium]|nr:WYL domain-containing protein [Muribaculaceae bacterium]
MYRDQLSTMLWIVDVITQHGSLSKKEIDRLWSNSRHANGEEEIPRRTFYNYLKAIDEKLGIEVLFDNSSKKYFIKENGFNDRFEETMNNWLLNAVATHGVLHNVKELSHKIFLEEVPSARKFLHPILEALKSNNIIYFDYKGYDRSLGHTNLMVEPYFLNIFRQRWYMTGRNVRENRIKTYALDRMNNLRISSQMFDYPENFDPKSFTSDYFGVIFSNGQTRKVVLRVKPIQAKYIRAVPLHHSQQAEEDHNGDVIFTYELKLTRDFVSELLAMGDNVTVIEPVELRNMVTKALRDALSNYGTGPT